MLNINLNETTGLPNNLSITGSVYPVTITAAYMDAYTPQVPANAFYKAQDDEDAGGITYTIPSRDALYQLIMHTAYTLNQQLAERFQLFLGAPADDESFDIDACMDLLNTLNQIGTL